MFCRALSGFINNFEFSLKNVDDDVIVNNTIEVENRFIMLNGKQIGGDVVALQRALNRGKFAKKFEQLQ